MCVDRKLHIYICLNKLGCNFGVRLTFYVYIAEVYKNNVVGSLKVHSGEDFINMVLLLLPDLEFNGKIKWDLDRKPVQRDKACIP